MSFAYSFPQVVRLLYTNNGIALLALGSNAVHKLWKWQRNERNPHGKVGPENFTCFTSAAILFACFLTVIFIFCLVHCICCASIVATAKWDPNDK
jgi:hypothetical protein